MCKQSPHLAKRAVLVGGTVVNEIRIPSTKSLIKPLAKTAGKVGSGKRPYFVVTDEVHEHPDQTVLQSLEEGFKWRREPLLLMITNSGLDDENSVCYIEHHNATKVATGMLQDDHLFGYVCALDENEDPLDTDLDPEILSLIHI